MFGMSRTIRILAFVTLAFFGLNYSWSHAALASLTSAVASCPSAQVSEARGRVEALVGDIQSNPRILCQNRPVFGFDISHGTTRFAPLLPSLVVIGPQGVNADVIAHEWMHAETAQRTSALLRTYRVPTWFDEGLAMQLDGRGDYDDSALRNYQKSGLIKTIALDQLAWPGQFFHNGDEGKANYAFAKCVVGRWLSVAGRGGVADFLKDVSWGRSFPTPIFEQHAKSCLARNEL